MSSKAQGALELLLLIGGAILVAVIAITIITSASEPVGQQAGQNSADALCKTRDIGGPCSGNVKINNQLFLCDDSSGTCYAVSQGADSDGDGLGDGTDNCPNDSNPGQEDSDGDGVGNVCDNCPNNSNSNQQDTDQDGIGDACEGDRDGDGLIDDNDQCPDEGLCSAQFTCKDNDTFTECIWLSNGCQQTTDTDCTIGKLCNQQNGQCEEDSDGDGIVDSSDNCPNDPNPGQENIDGDAKGDVCDDETILLSCTSSGWVDGETYYLGTDLITSGSQCIFVGTFGGSITIDCLGKSINGTGPTSEGMRINNQTTTFVTVKRCAINTLSGAGIFSRARVNVIDSNFSSSGAGINLANTGANNSVLQNNRFNINGASSGIIVASLVTGITISDNYLCLGNNKSVTINSSYSQHPASTGNTCALDSCAHTGGGSTSEVCIDADSGGTRNDCDNAC